jgi:hypothetical protein
MIRKKMLLVTAALMASDVMPTGLRIQNKAQSDT